jgi:hypothetical protein
MHGRHLKYLALILPCLMAGACSPQKPEAVYPDPPQGSFEIAVFDLAWGEGPVPSRVAVVTPEFFDVMKAPVYIGRPFHPDDFVPRRSSSLMVGYQLWNDKLHANPDVIGKTVTLSGREFVIIGVLPPAFTKPAGVEIWIPQSSRPY